MTDEEIKEYLEFHEDFGTWLRKEGYSAEYVKMKCQDFVEILHSRESALKDELLKKMEEAKRSHQDIEGIPCAICFGISICKGLVESIIKIKE